ncbi:uncharacterized protein LOC135376933 isoform X2 [Ornithodoros turicata]|uniref:uncharacterized protein LOC135376933 isoform X2 n=1 Tax=Ornithodoros turicata TaxID=34597 RepID=UPI0031387FD4
MSYPVVDDSKFSFKQKQMVTKARSGSGIHITDTCGTPLSNSSQTFSRLFPKPLADGVTITIVIFYEVIKPIMRFRVEDPSNGMRYFEIYMNDGLKYYVYFGKDDSSKRDVSTTYTLGTGVHVFQMTSSGDKVTCTADGGNALTTTYTLTPIRKHIMFDKLDTSPILLEEHVTYSGAGATKVFDYDSDFEKPSATLSPGGYVTWAGDANGQVVVQYNDTTIFDRNITRDDVRITMKVYVSRILIGLTGEESALKDNPKKTLDTNPMYSLTISKSMKLKNFDLHTGSVRATYF